MAPRDTDTDNVARKKLCVAPIEGKLVQEEEEEWIEPMTFRPTMEEFKNLNKYVSYMESCGAHLAGIAKIVPPAEWQPNGGPKEDWYNPANMDFTIQTPLQQTMKPSKTHGAFENTSKKLAEMTIPQFVNLATDSRHVTPPHESYEELEKLYWSYDNDKFDRTDDPVYGADVPQTLTRDDMDVWNISRLESLLTENFNFDLAGVNTPYLYFGMWKATFSWHVEDLDLHGVNFIHYGAPKTWYCVPPKHGYKLEQAANQLFPEWNQHCFNFLRHKVCMMSPKLLTSRGVKVHKITQEEREMVVVFPHAYHSGFNHGFNIAEAANFALPRWVEYGKRCRPCTCLMGVHGEAVDFDALEFGDFVKKYQPEKLELYESGKDIGPHPEDPQYIKDAYQFCLNVLNEDGEKDEDSEQVNKENIGETSKQVIKEKWILSTEDGKEIESGETPKNVMAEGEEEMTEEQKRKKLKANCRKLLKHMKLYRDLPKDLYLNKNAVEVEEIKVNDESPTENLEVEDEGMALFELREEKKCDIKLHHDRSELMMSLIAKIPKTTDSPKKGRKKEPLEKKKRIGFAGISEEELQAKKSKMVCKRKHRLMACGKCIGCRAEDCGKCVYCKDKPKFGGKNIQKQKCMDKVCKNPEVRTCDDCRWNL